MLLLRGRPDTVTTWARRGLLPVHVVPLPGWTAVLPAGPSQAMPPYDDTLKTFAGRPIAFRLRSAIGLFAVDGNAVVTVHLSGRRAVQRWFVWSPGLGLVRPQRLAAGRPADLIVAAGIGDQAAGRVVRDLLADPGGDVHAVIGDLLTLLRLPGSDLLVDGADPTAVQGATLVEPDEQQVARFERIIGVEARNRVELEED
jgi:hypothetical protein